MSAEGGFCCRKSGWLNPEGVCYNTPFVKCLKFQKGNSLQAKKIALLAREAAEDKKAEEPVVLDVSKLTSLAHYFLVMHGNSDRHVRAIAQNIMEVMDQKEVKCWHREGMESGQWVLLDYGPVIIHIFYKEIREFYNLERLWGDAPKL